jgi:DNA-directed RNA polymerase specialized sigma24 family protein
MYSLHSIEIEFPSKAEVPSDMAERNELHDILNFEIERLPRHERDALRALAGTGDESCRAMARRCGTSPQTVSNWAAIARQKLQPRLETYR